MVLIVEFICELFNGVYARSVSYVETLCNIFLL